MVAPKKTNYEPGHHSSNQNVNNMDVVELNSILSLVARGARLSHALYDFSASVPVAANDISKLAKEVNLLALELRHAGTSLEKDRNFPSHEACQTVSEILTQSQAVFQEIEAVLPVKGARDVRGMVMDGGDAMFPANWEWGQSTRLKTGYLLGHLDGLKLTLSVLLQCLYVAKITMWSRYMLPYHACYRELIL
jgi:hypothetical protein